VLRVSSSSAGPAAQRLRVLPETFTVASYPDADLPAVLADPGWRVLVRAPDGLTAIRVADPDGPGTRWHAVYGGDTGHGLDVPGMLAALVSPLAAAGIPVFVASTFAADLVLVPAEHTPAALRALRAAGHQVAA
jgi:hypothetical protein